jgi:LemA protein
MYLWLLLIVVVAFLIFSYNDLVRKSNQVKEAFSLVDVYLKQRFDLLPNLVEVVRQYQGHERGVLESLTALRSRAENPALTATDRIGLNNELQSAVRQLFVSVENYPVLQTSPAFLQLQKTWENVEENIAAARRTYNAAATRNNTAQQQFPMNLLNALFGFPAATLLETPDSERANISAKDLFSKS